MNAKVFLNQIANGKDKEKNKRLLRIRLASLLQGKVKFPYSYFEVADEILKDLT